MRNKRKPFRPNEEGKWKFIVRGIFFPFQILLLIFHILVGIIWSRIWGKMASKGGSPNDGVDRFNGTSDFVADGNNKMSESVAAIRRHHKQAYACIAKALNIDETAGNCDAKEKAVEWYQKGIDELIKGINIKCDEEGPEWERARNLQSKMEDNLNSTTERMNELVALLASQASSSTRQPLHNIRPKPAKVKLTDSSAPKDLKKPANSSNSPTVIKSRVTDINQPVIGKPQVNLDRRKPATSIRTNRRQYGQTEPGRSTTVKSTATLDELKSNQKRKVSYLKTIDSKIAEKILDEVVQNSPDVTFDDIAGMDNAKRILQEIVILPALRPELFTGLRAPARGLLLYGPPGNGKTMLAKAVSHQAKATFFNISASTLTSKWVGEGEKLVRALFAVARELQPSIIFIDEIDSLLCERKEGEMESSRRMKTEFLLAFDGVTSGENERILVMGATNRPQELDDAALRRLVKRVYLPLPDKKTRKILLEKLLKKHHSPLTDAELDRLATSTENYSGSDLTALARDAALGPIREMRPDQLQTVAADKVRNINYSDFVNSMKNVRASVSPETLKIFQEWTKTYGTQA